MPNQQSQYQVRFALALDAEHGADIVCWADPFELGGQPAGTVLLTLRNHRFIAEQILAEQTARNARTSVLIVAAPSAAPNALPTAQLAAAGALVEALSALGVDHSSPEAAVVRAAWVGIAPVMRHLLGASVDARILGESGAHERVSHALHLDATLPGHTPA